MKTLKANTINPKKYYILTGNKCIELSDRALKNRKIELKRISGSKIDEHYTKLQKLEHDFYPTDKEEKIYDILNNENFKNIIISGQFLSAFQAYIKDGFKLESIDKNSKTKEIVAKFENAKISTKYYIVEKLIISDKKDVELLATLDKDDIKKIETSLKFVSSDESRELLTGININNNDITATNGIYCYFDKLSFNLNNITFNSEDLSIAIKAIKKEKLTNIKLEKADNKYYLNGVEIRTIVGNYPNMQACIPSDFYGRVKFFKENIPNKPCLNPYTKECTLTDLGFCIFNNIDNTITDIKFDIESNMAFDMDFNFEYLKTVIKCVDSKIIKMQIANPKKAVLINDNFLLMPIVNLNKDHKFENKYNSPKVGIDKMFT